MMEAGSGMEWAESGRTAAGIAFDFPAGDPSMTPSGSPPARVPPRIRRRLMESRGGSSPVTAEEIEAKLREADLRRQQFHEWLSSKARPKPRSPSWSSQEDDHGQRLEAKLYAAEQKRLSLLSKAQMRLARLDELRQAAKTSVELRYEKEREQLGTKVESRVQQAEANRMLLLKANRQRKVAAQERSARLLLQRINKENKYKECVRTAISQKRAAAEKKRLGLLEAEKTRAHARVMQVCRVAKSVCRQREIERLRMKERLEERLQRAKWQRTEYLKQRGSSRSSSRTNWRKMHRQAEILSRKLARCWRQFVKSKQTTLTLAKAYDNLQINENSVCSMPFEQLARRIQSATTLQIVKALLERLESRLVLSQSNCSPGPENIDHLLKRLGSPSRRGSSSKATRTRGQMKKGHRETKCGETQKLSRYPVRVMLCAYMILGHPDAVFNRQGEREDELANAAVNFVREVELLMKTIVDGPQSSRGPSPEAMLDDQKSVDQLPSRHSFKSQLASFDTAWRAYLHQFVAWKVKDARLLEDDMVRATCQLELSMMQTCKVTADGKSVELTHDMKAIQKQVTEDQQLLREKVKHLSGDAGIERMESALSETRSKFFEAKENGDNFATPVAHISSPLLPTSSLGSMDSPSEKRASLRSNSRTSSVARPLFVDDAPFPPESKQGVSAKYTQTSSSSIGPLLLENELLVNEILHENRRDFLDGLDAGDEDKKSVKVQIQETMEKAFWDRIMESLATDQPNYGTIVGLVKEVRDELYEMAPQNWKQEITERIDIVILTQVLESGSLDMDHLGKILEYALSVLQKLSAPANEDEIKMTHWKLLSELSDIAQASDSRDSSFVDAVVKGLRFVLEEIKALKKEISKARIHMMVPIIKSSGVEYLQKAFGNQYGSPSDSANKLPKTKQWLSSLHGSLNEWDEYTESTLLSDQGLPPANSLRSGGSALLSSNHSSTSSHASSSGNEEPECKGERVDLLLRLGLMKLVTGIEGLKEETLPETLKLNLLRLRSVQGNFQKFVVISTSMLVLRQILLSENIVARPADIESMVSNSFKSLCGLLERTPDVGIVEIVDTIASSSSEEKLQQKKEVMARMMVKSLQAGDAVYEKVSRSVYLAGRAIVLGGSGVRGRRGAEASLRRVGASLLLDQVVEAMEVLIVVARISGQVHRAWYEGLIA